MVACNAGVWTLFVKALQNVESSLTATVTSAASNYCLSVRAPNRDYFQLNPIFRRLQVFFVFGEVTTLIWWSGMSLIICGLLLVVKDQPEEHVAKKQD
jgi:drug/metabolite transporter (DMT)-like permease